MQRVSTFTESSRPSAPAPEAVVELTRPDGRVLVVGENVNRLRDLAEGLLRVGCRVEIAALPCAPGSESLGIADHRLTVVDTIQLARASADAVYAARAEATSQPIIAITLHGSMRHRLIGAHYVVAGVDDAGELLNAPQVVRDILSTWSTVRPLVGPGDLRIDRIGRRASVRGRQLALRPIDFQLLRLLAEHSRHGCTLDELREAASNGRPDHRRASAEVRHALERLRSRFRRTDVTVVSAPDGRYRLTARVEKTTPRRNRPGT
jgi:DNA-binding response OmpR family regulator